jgi:CheY-like chemotaxis protein
MRESMRRLLEPEGYSVELAADGEHALQAQRERPAHILITDIFMPGKEGIETIEQFRAEFPQVRIIAMSGGAHFISPKTDYLSIAAQIGADATLRKPFEFDDLLGILRQLPLR